MTVSMVTLVGFPIPGLKAVNPTNSSHGHWATNATRVKAARYATWAAATSVGLTALAPGATATVTLTRLAPSPLDDDNLRPALKGVRDQIAKMLGVDDRDPRVSWEYSQERGGVREYAVLVLVQGKETRP